MLEQQLQDEQQSTDEKSARISKLEKDIRDLRVQLETKLETSLWNFVKFRPKKKTLKLLRT